MNVLALNVFLVILSFALVPIFVPFNPHSFSWSVWIWAAFEGPLPGCHGPRVSGWGSLAAREALFFPESRRLIQTARRRCGERSRPAGWMNSSLESTVNRRGGVAATDAKTNSLLAILRQMHCYISLTNKVKVSFSVMTVACLTLVLMVYHSNTVNSADCQMLSADITYLPIYQYWLLWHLINKKNKEDTGETSFSFLVCPPEGTLLGRTWTNKYTVWRLKMSHGLFLLKCLGLIIGCDTFAIPVSILWCHLNIWIWFGWLWRFDPRSHV